MAFSGSRCSPVHPQHPGPQFTKRSSTSTIVGRQDLDGAVRKLLAKGKAPGADRVKLESITEGLCVQMLHVGPYEEECRSIAVMQAFAEQQGLMLCGRHHEVYLSDPRRIPPERLKTILRLPVKKM